MQTAAKLVRQAAVAAEVKSVEFPIDTGFTFGEARAQTS
jgi:hypothetical protein